MTRQAAIKGVRSPVRLAARVVGIVFGPYGDKALEIGIDRFWKCYDEAHVKVPRFALGRRDALALKSQDSARIGPFGNAETDRAGRRRHLDARALNRFDERDRHLDVEIVALALEARVRRDGDLDEGIARWAATRPRPTFAFQAQLFLVIAGVVLLRAFSRNIAALMNILEPVSALALLALVFLTFCEFSRSI
mgnify:CR=1 FL=1